MAARTTNGHRVWRALALAAAVGVVAAVSALAPNASPGAGADPLPTLLPTTTTTSSTTTTTTAPSPPPCQECDLAYEADGATNANHRLDVYYTTRTAGSPRPAVLFIHQGGWSGGNKQDYIDSFAQDLTKYKQPTWVAFSMNYTLHGATRHPPGPYPVQPQEVADAIAWIQSHASTYNIDATKIGLFGSSAGAHLAMLAAASAPGKPGDPGKPAAVVEWSGPTELADMVNDFGCSQYNCAWTGPQWPGSAVQDFEGDCLAVAPVPSSPYPQCPDNRYNQTSGVKFVNACTPPMLLVHSDADSTVPPEQEKQMATALGADGVPYQELLLTTNAAASPPYKYDPTAAHDHGYPSGSAPYSQLYKYAWYYTPSYPYNTYQAVSPTFLKKYLVDTPWVPAAAC